MSQDAIGNAPEFQDMLNDLHKAAGEHSYVHHIQDSGYRVNVKMEKNSRGFNYEITVTNASSVDEAIALATDAKAKMEAALEPKPEPEPEKKEAPAEEVKAK